MDENIAMFSLCYILFCSCLIFQTLAFSCLSIKFLCSGLLGNEMDNFIYYHIKRSSCTVFIHASLLLVYRLGVSWVANFPLVEDGVTIFNVIGALGISMSITATLIIYNWRKNNWENHPISQKLIFLNENEGTWRNLASLINIELRREHKVVFRSTALMEVFVTEHWIVKVSPYSLDFAHQRGSTLTVVSADMYALAPTGPGISQFVNIKVTNTRRENYTFYIRLNVLDIKDLEDMLRRPVIVPQNVTFYRSIADQFLDVFKEHVSQNPYYRPVEELEPCVGCFTNMANVKLMKRCFNDEETEPCGICHCKPMWCVSCMGRWFCSRQDEEHPEIWLSSKCTCPLCRSVFCILDVSLVYEL